MLNSIINLHISDSTESENAVSNHFVANEPKIGFEMYETQIDGYILKRPQMEAKRASDQIL